MGYTLVPLKMYFRHGKIKVEIGLATGKSCTTSGRTWQRKRRSAIWRGGSKNSGMIEFRFSIKNGDSLMENFVFSGLFFYDGIHPFESSCHIAVTRKVSDGFAVHQKFYFLISEIQ